MTESKQTALQAYLELQKTVTNPVADTEAFKYKYAPLPNVLDHVREAVTDAGFVIKQSIGESIQTELVFAETGEVVNTVALPSIETTDAQKLGSWITYMRRYGILTVLGISAEDDDGKETKNDKPATVHKVSTTEYTQMLSKITNAESLEELEQLKPDIAKMLPFLTGDRQEKLKNEGKRMKEAFMEIDQTHADLDGAFDEQMADDKA